jgi:phospholipase/carboxylesterase
MQRSAFNIRDVALCPARARRYTAAVADLPADEERYLNAALHLAAVARDFLAWMESVGEQLAPQRSSALALETRRRFGDPLPAAVAALDVSPPSDALAPFAERVRQGAVEAQQAYELFATFPEAPPPERIVRILGALHHLARAQEHFYTVRLVLPPFAGYWLLPGAEVEDRTPQRNEEGKPLTGILHVSRGGHHGGFSLYVPEHYTAERSWPVVVALHGGSGNGRDFLWTWLREAKSRGYVLISPSSVNDTWSDVEERGLFEILEWTGERFHLDPSRVLLTGLSDGGTFALIYGLAHPNVFRALAPLCGVLHPANSPLGNLARARGVPIYLVHGALDFLFPVQLAQLARDTLLAHGAALEYRELPELSHTYPRSENVRILDWFEGLADGADGGRGTAHGG